MRFAFEVLVSLQLTNYSLLRNCNSSFIAAALSFEGDLVEGDTDIKLLITSFCNVVFLIFPVHITFQSVINTILTRKY
jgi:hypothetical protein